MVCRVAVYRPSFLRLPLHQDDEIESDFDLSNRSEEDRIGFSLGARKPIKSEKKSDDDDIDDGTGRESRKPSALSNDGFKVPSLPKKAAIFSMDLGDDSSTSSSRCCGYFCDVCVYLDISEFNNFNFLKLPLTHMAKTLHLRELGVRDMGCRLRPLVAARCRRRRRFSQWISAMTHLRGAVCGGCLCAV